MFHIVIKVNDLYENKNLYMIVDNLYNIGGMVRRKSLQTWIFLSITASESITSILHWQYTYEA